MAIFASNKGIIMDIGKLIESLILTNLKIWHEDTKLRQGKELENKNIVEYGAAGRKLNAIRSELKYQINHIFGDDAFDDRKVNYSEGDNNGS
jgi:hypothetical protein